LKTTSNIINN